MPAPDHHHFVATMTASPAGGAANPALIDFDFRLTSAQTVNQLAARIIAYLAGYGASFGAGASAVAGVTYRLASVAGSVDVAFPQTEYDAVRAVFPGLPTLEGYGETIGDGNLTPIGTSVLVREFTANPTRRGKGRHYLPFIGADFINASGQLSGSTLAEIESNYGALFLGQVVGGDSIPATQVCVVSNAGNMLNSITNVTAQPTCSNLRTRRR